MKALQRALFASALLALSSGVIQANVINGTLGFADIGSPSAGTGNINTATTFTLGDLTSTTGTGDFTGLPTQDFGSISFDTAVGSSLSFTSSTFGTFTSTSITKISNAPGSVAFFILGTFASGSYAGYPSPGATADSSSFTLGFTQTPAGTGAISDSATFSDPPAPLTGTPEPATLGLFGSAFVALGLIRRRRKA